MAVVELTKKTFEEEVLKETLPVMIVFYRKGDAFCEEALVEAKKLSGELSGQAKICTVDVDEEIALAFQYQVMDIPLCVFMNYGIFQKRVSGKFDASKAEQLLRSLKAENGIQHISF